MVCGDFNGDGIDDLAVSSIGHASSGVIQSGLVDIFHGPGLAHGFTVPNPLPGVGDKFGYRLDAADLDGDGFCDLAVATPFKSLAPGGGDWSGALFVMNGPSFGTFLKVLPPIPAVEGGFGAGCDAGDFNGDGIPDLMVGEFWWSPPHRSGQAHILLGPTYETAITLLEPIVGINNQFGRRIRAGDLDGDGRKEMIIGVPQSSPGGISRAGSVYVVKQ